LEIFQAGLMERRTYLPMKRPNPSSPRNAWQVVVVLTRPTYTMFDMTTGVLSNC
jgi:hypothetical protein